MWEGGEEKEYPRRAGISSFGAGGANAHVVIEEYQAPAEAGGSGADMPALIVLSGRDKTRLAEQSSRLLSVLESAEGASLSLLSVAYTLQTGREGMDERVGWVVSSIAELKDRLRSYGLGKLEEGYEGDTRSNKEWIREMTGNEELEEAVGKWLERGKYAKLLEWWVRGLPVEWERLYRQGEGRPCRVSLPGYPFARERYWLSPPVKSNGTIEPPPDSREDELYAKVLEDLMNDTLSIGAAAEKIRNVN